MCGKRGKSDAGKSDFSIYLLNYFETLFKCGTKTGNPADWGHAITEQHDLR